MTSQQMQRGDNNHTENKHELNFQEATQTVMHIKITRQKFYVCSDKT